MSDLYQKKVRKRTAILAFFFLTWFAGLLFRLVQLQVFNHARYKAEVIEQNQNKRKIIPKRGSIYDRKGKILARSLPVQSVFYTPLKGESYQSQIDKVRKLGKVLDLSQNELERIKTRIEKKDRFIWVKRKIDPEEEDSVKRLSLPGVFFQEENKRFYPQGTLAAHILGRVNIDDEGHGGVEYRYEAILKGKIGECLILRDAKRREYHLETLKAPEPGKDLILTIDETIQYIAERALEKAIRDNNANWGAVIISRPINGEILALASYPTYDPNNDPPSAEEEINRAIRYNFEPGSTFKIVTASAAREKGLVSLSDTFDCSKGAVFIAGRSIQDHKVLGLLTFPEVLIHSSNVGTIQISQRIGKNFLYQMINAFRFGEKTRIDLPGEEPGIFRPLSNWTRSSLPSLAIGYEISVTAIQVLQAINVIANRGIMTRPKVVKEILDSPQKMRTRPPLQRRILSEKTSAEIVRILERVVEEGTGKDAQIIGYKIGGKTGTAQKFDRAAGSYSSSRHLASFVGIVPTDKPLFSMIVVIDEPKTGYQYGGEVAAPLFREIARRVLLYLHVPPQEKPLATTLTAQAWRELKR